MHPRLLLRQSLFYKYYLTYARDVIAVLAQQRVYSFFINVESYFAEWTHFSPGLAFIMSQVVFLMKDGMEKGGKLQNSLIIAVRRLIKKYSPLVPELWTIKSSKPLSIVGFIFR